MSGLNFAAKGSDGASCRDFYSSAALIKKTETCELRYVSDLGNNTLFHSAYKAIEDRISFADYLSDVTAEAAERYREACFMLGLHTDSSEFKDLHEIGIVRIEVEREDDCLYAAARDAIVKRNHSLEEFLKNIEQMAADAYRLANGEMSAKGEDSMLLANQLIPPGEILIERWYQDNTFSVWSVITSRPIPDPEDIEP